MSHLDFGEVKARAIEIFLESPLATCGNPQKRGFQNRSAFDYPGKKKKRMLASGNWRACNLACTRPIRIHATIAPVRRHAQPSPAALSPSLNASIELPPPL